MTDRPCLRAWVVERLENCEQFAADAQGEDRAGWLDDARYFHEIMDMIVARPGAGLPDTEGERPGAPQAAFIRPGVCKSGDLVGLDMLARDGKVIAHAHMDAGTAAAFSDDLIKTIQAVIDGTGEPRPQPPNTGGIVN